MNRKCQAASGPLLRGSMVGIALLALTACGDRVTRPDKAEVDVEPVATPQEQVKRRALSRWNFLIERDFSSAYDLLSPGYRQVLNREAYIKTMKDRPVQWTSIVFREATCEPDVCAVEIQVNVQFQMPVMRVGTVDAVNVVTENWILSDGEWYLVPKADR